MKIAEKIIKIFLLKFRQFLDIKTEGGEEGWTGATIALANPGGIRAGLAKGDIVWGDLAITTPFENKLHCFELPGKAIRDAFEFSAANLESPILLQVSGLKVVYNISVLYSHHKKTVFVQCSTGPEIAIKSFEKLYETFLSCVFAI